MKMTLLDASCQADEMCVIYCRAHANLCLQCENAMLTRFKTKSGNEHIVWLDYDLLRQGIVSYCRAFYEGQELENDDLSEPTSGEVIKPDHDVFRFNDNTYFLHAAPNGNYSIRLLKVLHLQRVVEKIESEYEDGPIYSTFLVNFYTLDGIRKNYAMTCWGVSRSCSTAYHAVFTEESCHLSDFELSHFMREELAVGEIFKHDGYYYRVTQNAEGKLELERSKMVFTLFKKEDAQPEKTQTSARVVLMNSVKKGG